LGIRLGVWGVGDCVSRLSVASGVERVGLGARGLVLGAWCFGLEFGVEGQGVGGGVRGLRHVVWVWD